MIEKHSSKNARSGDRRKGRAARLAIGLAVPLAAAAAAGAIRAAAPSGGVTVKVSLSEWAVRLTPARVPAGTVTFEVGNEGTIPHGFEIEGRGIEREAAQIPRGGHERLVVKLRPGAYEAYCPVGEGSHMKLGMRSALVVTGAGTHVASARASAGTEYETHEMHDMRPAGAPGSGPRAIEVEGGGPVIQILPGPFPFADSAAAVIRSRPDDQRTDLTAKAAMGPYSNRIAPITGTIRIFALDRGASGDSVSGVAEFTAQDGARWKVVMDRVQTRDIPDNPRFGGVIMGLYYHGASGVHTPLVPTIQSRLALWAYAHLYRNDSLVTDAAMVHVMLLSRTRRAPDFALACWDCTHEPIEELQLQVTAAPGEPKFEAPGGFLFVNWEKSSGADRAAP
jgi:hypothetical protein